jgi:hypothetical protein
MLSRKAEALGILLGGSPDLQHENFQYRDVEAVSSLLRETSGDAEPSFAFHAALLLIVPFSHPSNKRVAQPRRHDPQSLRPRCLPLLPLSSEQETTGKSSHTLYTTNV